MPHASAADLLTYVEGGEYYLTCAECDAELGASSRELCAQVGAQEEWTIVQGRLYCKQCADAHPEGEV